jgi:uncharacterized protein YuzE
MRISYDPDVDAAYIAIGKRGQPVTTQVLDDDVNVDFGADGQVVGIEVLNARERLRFGDALTVQIDQPLPAPQPA